MGGWPEMPLQTNATILARNRACWAYILQTLGQQGPYKTMTATATGTSKWQWLNEQNNCSAIASRFFVHFFAIPEQLQRERVKF